MSKPLRVLIVEDSENDALLLIRELRRGGYEPVLERVETQESMKSALRERQWDVIISDYILPKFSGLSALAVLKESGLDLPFIIVSGNIGEDIAIETMKAGAHDYIIKGNLKRLVPAVERELREAEVRHERRWADEKMRQADALLRLFSQTIGRKEYLDGVVRLIQEWSHCHSLGIRILDENPRIPYESFIGVNHKFWKAENWLSTENNECICVRVIKGKTDPHESSVLTPYGSFYSNNTYTFVEGLSEQRKTRYRDSCIYNGFLSVSVIPVRYRDKVLGAIHIADERPSMVPLGMVEFIESISPIIGEALFRFSIEDQLRQNIEALQKSEKSLTEAQRIATMGNWEWDLSTNELHWSDEVYRIFGLDPHQFRRTYVAFLNHVHPDDRGSVREAINAALYEQKPYSIEHRIVLEDGTLKVVHERGEVTFADGEPIRMVGTVQDITERKIQEEKLRNSREQLRNLSAHLHTVREQERTSIAREIHDELGQSLTALKMDISWLSNKYRDNELLLDKTRTMIKLIDSTIRTVKRISSELRPVVLDDLGLVAAIEWQAEEFQKRTGIECELHFHPEDVSLDRAVSTTIFRIFQEALTNVIRHAEATKVWVSLKKEDGKMVLSVQDNGKGITEKQKNDPRSFGLIGIRERVISLGGMADIKGVRNRGTALTIAIPLEYGEGTGDANGK